MASEQRLRSGACQLGLHHQHLPGEGLGHLVHCDLVAREAVSREPTQVQVVTSAAGRVLRLRPQALRPCTCIDHLKAPPPHKVSLDPSVEDTDSCRGTQDRPIAAFGERRYTPKSGTSGSGDAPWVVSASANAAARVTQLRPRERPPPKQRGDSTLPPVFAPAPALLQAVEGLRALSLQLVDALHQHLDRGIFLRSRGHGWA